MAVDYLKVIAQHICSDWVKPLGTPVRIFDSHTEIWTRKLPNTKAYLLVMEPPRSVY
jgi:hypothetical protein